MNDLQKELDRAFLLLSDIPVSGDAVDLMSMAREHLRTAYKLAGDKQALWTAHKQAEKEADKHGG